MVSLDLSLKMLILYLLMFFIIVSLLTFNLTASTESDVCTPAFVTDIRTDLQSVFVVTDEQIEEFRIDVIAYFRKIKSFALSMHKNFGPVKFLHFLLKDRAREIIPEEELRSLHEKLDKEIGFLKSDGAAIKRRPMALKRLYIGFYLICETWNRFAPGEEKIDLQKLFSLEEAQRAVNLLLRGNDSNEARIVSLGIPTLDAAQKSMFRNGSIRSFLTTLSSLVPFGRKTEITDTLIINIMEYSLEDVAPKYILDKLRENIVHTLGAGIEYVDKRYGQLYLISKCWNNYSRSEQKIPLDTLYTPESMTIAAKLLATSRQ